jgi:hypothetical protein
MTYYVLVRGGREMFSMNTLLTEDEAQRYGEEEGRPIMVKAACVWTRSETLELFRMWLSTAPPEQTAALSGLIRAVRAGRVDAQELSTRQLSDRLRALHHAVRPRGPGSGAGGSEHGRVPGELVRLEASRFPHKFQWRLRESLPRPARERHR